jgi:hypothetical protein
MAGQPELGSNGFVEMDVSNFQVRSGGLPSALILDPGQNCELCVDIELGGIIWPGLQSLMKLVPGPDFEVEYFFESIGAGPEGSLGKHPITADPTKTKYEAIKDVIPSNLGLKPGTYKVVAVVRVKHKGLEFITGYAEGPILQQR